MHWTYRHWYQVGMIFALAIAVFLAIHYQEIDPFKIILLLSLITLFLHQFEEYQWPGGFPQMVNAVMFKSPQPRRYPLNPRTAFIINVGLGWSAYLLAFIFASSAVWLAVATIVVSLGNFFAHTFLFNLKGHSYYNPGMATAALLFLPLTIYFFIFGIQHGLFTTTNLLVGILLGAALNYFGVIKLITLLAKKSPDREYV